MQAAPATVEPVIDGQVLDDPAWSVATPARNFWQNNPDEGQPATQDTEVYVVFTDKTLFIGVVCYDDDPSKIIVADSRRDSSLVETDSFQIILDTYLDRQTGFVFGTNPAGIQYDGQVNREGDGGFLTGGGFNLNWNGDWDVTAAISEIGWSAEFAIPLRTLRYGRADPMTWGVNLQRNIRRRNENAFWAPLPRQFNLYRLSLAGTMAGLDLPPQRNLNLTPYVLTTGRRPGVEGAEIENDQEIGIDVVKYSITPALTLDLTYNTDFAQVEADELQISLDRFNLFFPEKRPFFLENSGLFTVGRSQQVELFFSRRIGLSDDGEIIPIDGGARLSGALLGANVGLMYLQTDALDGVASPTGFAVARVNKELPNRSSLGAVVVDKAVSSRTVAGETDNRTWGVDGQWGIGQYGMVSGYVAQTDTPGLEGDDSCRRCLPIFGTH